MSISRLPPDWKPTFPQPIHVRYQHENESSPEPSFFLEALVAKGEPETRTRRRRPSWGTAWYVPVEGGFALWLDNYDSSN